MSGGYRKGSRPSRRRSLLRPTRAPRGILARRRTPARLRSNEGAACHMNWQCLMRVALRVSACSVALVLGLIATASAQDEKMVVKSTAPFQKVASTLVQAIADEKMGLVCHANAQAGAASWGVKIQGNQVLMVFRPDFAIRMLKASVEAGIEAPIRIYIYENSDGTATVTYRKPP